MQTLANWKNGFGFWRKYRMSNIACGFGRSG